MFSWCCTIGAFATCHHRNNNFNNSTGELSSGSAFHFQQAGLSDLNVVYLHGIGCFLFRVLLHHHSISSTSLSPSTLIYRRPFLIPSASSEASPPSPSASLVPSSPSPPRRVSLNPANHLAAQTQLIKSSSLFLEPVICGVVG